MGEQILPKMFKVKIRKICLKPPPFDPIVSSWWFDSTLLIVKLDHFPK